MDASSFLQYVESIQFPRLSGDQEFEIRKNVENVLDKYFPDVESYKRDEMVDAFEQTIKFFALLVSAAIHYFKNTSSIIVCMRFGLIQTICSI